MLLLQRSYGILIKATTAHFDKMIDVIADMVQTPKLLAEEIEEKKSVIREEINMYEDMPQRKWGDLKIFASKSSVGI